jgi:outer membrane lipoprotein-sorting protein
MLLAFTNVEEKGQKILRLRDEIYLYFPDAEEVVRLQGAALKDSVLGSDFSYEDLTGERSILDLYEVRLLGTEPSGGREQHLLELKAKGRGVAYPLQKLWVDSQSFLPRKAEYYALSGRLLKTLEVLETRQAAGRSVITRAIMRDAMKKNASTEFRVQRVKIDEPLPKNLFSLEALSW